MRPVSLFVLASLTLTAVACNSGDDGDSSGGDSPLLEMLGALPDDAAATKLLMYTDYERLGDIADVGSPGNDPDDINEWLGEFNNAAFENGADGPWGSSFVQTIARETEAARTELGFDITDIDQSIEAGSPPGEYHLLRGGFSSGDIDGAVHDDESWSDILEVKERNGLEYYSWGEDFAQDFDRSTPIRRLGVGSRLAVHDGLVFWCAATDGIEEMLDAASDNDESLADNEDFAAMAEALGEHDVYAAQFTNDTPSSPDSGIPMLAAYNAVAAGDGVDDEGPFMVLAVANPDEDTAIENIDRLQNRIEVGKTGGARGEPKEWATGIDSVEVDASGTLTIAVLRGPDLPYTFMLDERESEPFLLHESSPE